MSYYGGGRPNYNASNHANHSSSYRARSRSPMFEPQADRRAKRVEEKAMRARYLPDEVDFELDESYHGYRRGTERERERESERRGREREKMEREREKIQKEVERDLERAAREREKIQRGVEKDLERAARERDRAFEKAARERERVFAQMQSSLHVPGHASSSRARSRSTSRTRKDNDVELNLDFSDCDSRDYSAHLADVIKNQLSAAAATGGNINIHVNAPKRKTPEPADYRSSDASHSFFGIPGSGSEAPGKSRTRSPSPNPNLGSDPKPSASRKLSPSSSHGTSSTSHTPSHVPEPKTQRSRAPSLNPLFREPLVVDSEKIKKFYAALGDIKVQFLQLKNGFVFPSVVDFQRIGEDPIITVNVTRSVEELIASSIADDSLMDVDVDLAEVGDQDNAPKAKLAYTSTNYTINSYLDSLDKVTLRLDGVETYFDQDLRRARRELVMDIEREVENVGRFWTQVWKEEEHTKETTEAPEVHVGQEVVETAPEIGIQVEMAPEEVSEMQDEPTTPESEPSLTLTIESPVEEMNSMDQEESPVHVERPQSPSLIPDVKQDHEDHPTGSDEWIDVLPSFHASTSADAGPSMDMGASFDANAGNPDLHLDDDEPPSYEMTMSVTLSDGRDPVDMIDEEQYESSTLSSTSEKGKDKKVKPRQGQFHVVNADEEQDADWVPVNNKRL